MDTSKKFGDLESASIPALVAFMLRTQNPKECAQAVERCVEKIPDRMDLWFLAIGQHFSVLSDQHEAKDPANDLFRDLGTFNYAGTTWTEQLKRLQFLLNNETGSSDKQDHNSRNTGDENLAVMNPQTKPGMNSGTKSDSTFRKWETKLFKSERSRSGQRVAGTTGETSSVVSRAIDVGIEASRKDTTATTIMLTGSGLSPSTATRRNMENTPMMTQLVLPLPLQRGDGSPRHAHLISGIIGQIGKL
jgi:hypothetical protein